METRCHPFVMSDILGSGHQKCILAHINALVDVIFDVWRASLLTRVRTEVARLFVDVGPLPWGGAVNSVVVEDMSFGYGKNLVIRNLTIELNQGITVLLGPNGAGKTTLMKLIVGLLSPQRGTISVDGRVGYLEQNFAVMGSLKLHRHVAYAAWAAGVDKGDCNDRATVALKKVGLGDKTDVRVRKLSGGQRQRLGLACALAGSPNVVVLDEPTVGVDPAQRVQIRRRLKEFAEDSSVLISTHLVDDAIHMADRIVIMSSGQIVFDGDVMDLESCAPSDRAGMSRAEIGYLHVLEEWSDDL